MEEAKRGPLAGLVSQQAEELYARVLQTGWLEIGSGPSQVEVTSAAAKELIAARVCYRSHLHDDRFVPVTTSTALQLLLARQHAEIVKKQQTAIAGWELLDSILSTSIGIDEAGVRRSDSLVEVVGGREALNKLSYELYHSTRRELLGLATGGFSSPPTERQLLTPPEPTARPTGQFRMIYDGEVASDAAGAKLIEASIVAGEQARIRAHIPLKMLHVDDSIALVALTTTGVDGSMIVRSPTLLAALREWFEYLWTDEGTTVVDGVVTQELNASQRQVLRLMSAGMGDEAIARASNASVRTVRRHIAAILEHLGVNSRFAAGAMAVRRGWI